jgi:PIN domain nuclease of toxin-antitoxin system
MILLDTHILLMLSTTKRLSRAAVGAIARAEASDGIAIASITFWEIALLIHDGRITVRGSTEAFLKQLSQRPQLVAALAFQFPPDFPADPADRIIGATARAHGLQLVTRDRRMQQSTLLRTIW